MAPFFAANVNLSQAAKKAKSLKYVETVEEGENLIAQLLGHRVLISTQK